MSALCLSGKRITAFQNNGITTTVNDMITNLTVTVNCFSGAHQQNTDGLAFAPFWLGRIVCLTSVCASVCVCLLCSIPHVAVSFRVRVRRLTKIVAHHTQ